MTSAQLYDRNDSSSEKLEPHWKALALDVRDNLLDGMDYYLAWISAQHDQKVSSLLAAYQSQATQDLFHGVLAYVKQQCESLIQRLGVKATVQGRLKKYASLKKKLEEMRDAQEFREWCARVPNITLHPDLGDFVGIRIGLYFPDDIKAVAEQIEQEFLREHRFGTVMGRRYVLQGTDKDSPEYLDRKNIDHHMMPPLKDEAGDDAWEHYGYKSWQVVFKCKEPLSSDLQSKRERMPEDFKPLRFEVQVGTVVTQAWAEVQHDVVYKTPDSDVLLATPSIKRVLDAINGLAITTDVVLKELRQSIDTASREAVQRKRERQEREQAVESAERRPFEDGDDFVWWFYKTYLEKLPLEEQLQFRLPKRLTAYYLVRDCHSVIPACPAEFRKVIENNYLLQSERDLDIAELLIQALGLKMDILPVGNVGDEQFLRRLDWKNTRRVIDRIKSLRDNAFAYECQPGFDDKDMEPHPPGDYTNIPHQYPPHLLPEGEPRSIPRYSYNADSDPRQYRSRARVKLRWSRIEGQIHPSVKLPINQGSPLHSIDHER
jgi:ppGpp synthetase/RelA/SpoT-type nucleotidyltranferase